MTLKTLAYLLYLAITVPLTIYVARTLFRNGRVFLHDVFDGNDALADAVNRLLVVGFYLFNLGYVALFMQNDETIDEHRAAAGGAVDPRRPRRDGAGRRAPRQRLGVQQDPPPRCHRAPVGAAGRRPISTRRSSDDPDGPLRRSVPGLSPGTPVGRGPAHPRAGPLRGGRRRRRPSAGSRHSTTPPPGGRSPWSADDGATYRGEAAWIVDPVGRRFDQTTRQRRGARSPAMAVRQRQGSGRVGAPAHGGGVRSRRHLGATEPVRSIRVTGPQRRAERTRSAIIDAALTLFRERGLRRDDDAGDRRAGGRLGGQRLLLLRLQGAPDPGLLRPGRGAARRAVGATTGEADGDRRAHRDPPDGVVRAVRAIPGLRRRLLPQRRRPGEPAQPVQPGVRACSRGGDRAVARCGRRYRAATCPRSSVQSSPSCCGCTRWALVLFWVHDRSAQAVATRLVVARTVPIVVRAIEVSRLPALRGLLDDLSALLADLRAVAGSSLSS